jgi:hypothetical protein
MAEGALTTKKSTTLHIKAEATEEEEEESGNKESRNDESHREHEVPKACGEQEQEQEEESKRITRKEPKKPSPKKPMPKLGPILNARGPVKMARKKPVMSSVREGK